MVSIGTTVFSLGFLEYQYHNDMISGKEFTKRCVSTIVKYAAGIGGSILGGFCVSFTAFEILRFAGLSITSTPVGVVGLIAGVCGSYCGVKLADLFCDKCC